MAKMTSAQTERTRPSSRLRPQSLTEVTPVLFRLPKIEVYPVGSANEVLAPTTLQTIAEPRAFTAPSSSSSANSPRNDCPQIPLSATTNKVPDTAAKPLPTVRTWWEHWSSGVVMILLVIAVVTVGIMIFKSSSQSNNSTIAAQSHAEFGDLESIAIPSIEITDTKPTSQPGIELVQSGNQESHHDEPAVGSAQGTTIDARQQESLATDLANADVSPSPSPSMLPTSLLPSVAQNDPTADSSLPILTTPIPDQGRADSDNASASSISREPLATAQLLEPTPHGSLPASIQPTLPALPSLDGFSQNASVSPSGLSSASIPNLAGDTKSSPNALAVSNPVPVNSIPTSTSEVRTTSTPEANEEEIIRAYLELTRGPHALDESGGGALNRYQDNRR